MAEQQGDKYKDIIYVLDSEDKYGFGVQVWQTQSGVWRIKIAQVWRSQYGLRFSMRELNDKQKASGKFNPNVTIDPSLVAPLCEALLKAAEQVRENKEKEKDRPEF